MAANLRKLLGVGFLAVTVLAAGIAISVQLQAFNATFRQVAQFVALVVSATAWYSSARGHDSKTIARSDLANKGAATTVEELADEVAKELNTRSKSGLNVVAATGALLAIAFSSDLPDLNALVP